MLCSNCKKREAVYNVAGEDGEYYLCEECYQRLGEAAEFAMQPGSDLQPEEEEKRCPVCGMTFSDYKESGLLGCANCFRVFEEQLLPEIEKIQGETVHVGKRPLGDEELYRLQDRQKSLRFELEQALKEKRMQDAEKINREIRSLRRRIARWDFGGEDGQ